MAHTILFQQCFKFLFNQVGNIVTNEDAGDSDMGEDNLFEKSSDHSRVIGGGSTGFQPFGHIIHDDQDVFVPSGGWERPMKSMPQTSNILTSRM